MMTAALARVLEDVTAERGRQDVKWGEQNHDSFTWLAILTEEVGEAAQRALSAHFGGGKTNGQCGSAEEYQAFCRAEYRREMVQVAAVAIAMIECFDRVATVKDAATVPAPKPEVDDCLHCGGDGRLHGYSCQACGGTGKVPAYESCNREDATEYRERILTGSIGLEGAWSDWRSINDDPRPMPLHLECEYRRPSGIEQKIPAAPKPRRMKDRYGNEHDETASCAVHPACVPVETCDWVSDGRCGWRVDCKVRDNSTEGGFMRNIPANGDLCPFCGRPVRRMKENERHQDRN